jgi:hypothetical protein
MNLLRLLGKAIADSMLCAVQLIGCMLGSIPPMRPHSPLGPSAEFFYFLPNLEMIHHCG